MLPSDFQLGPTDWVEYDCIENDTGLGVNYLAIYCVLSKRRPLVAEQSGNSIIVSLVFLFGVKTKAKPET